MKRALITVVLSLTFIISCASKNKAKGNADIDLIVPGDSAEGFKLGEKIENNKYKIYKSSETSLAGVLGIEYFSYLKFDSIIQNGNASSVFLYEGAAVAIAGLTIERRTTSDAVLLSNGIDNFIINYGNTGLKIFKNKNHTVYIYTRYGIAVFDDNNDNVIDMYLVFK